MVFFSVWFLTKPVASLESAFSSEGWLITLRFHRLEPILCFLGFGCLLSIMGPKHFPFHARTNGVGPPQVQNPPHLMRPQDGMKVTGHLEPNQRTKQMKNEIQENLRNTLVITNVKIILKTPSTEM